MQQERQRKKQTRSLKDEERERERQRCGRRYRERSRKAEIMKDIEEDTNRHQKGFLNGAGLPVEKMKMTK
jgi:hypothetical protein